MIDHGEGGSPLRFPLLGGACSSAGVPVIRFLESVPLATRAEMQAVLDACQSPATVVLWRREVGGDARRDGGLLRGPRERRRQQEPPLVLRSRTGCRRSRRFFDRGHRWVVEATPNHGQGRGRRPGPEVSSRVSRTENRVRCRTERLRAGRHALSRLLRCFRFRRDFPGRMLLRSRHEFEVEHVGQCEQRPCRRVRGLHGEQTPNRLRCHLREFESRRPLSENMHITGLSRPLGLSGRQRSDDDGGDDNERRSSGVDDCDDVAADLAFDIGRSEVLLEGRGCGLGCFLEP